MFNWKRAVIMTCCLSFEVGVHAASMQENMWRSAYECSLRGDNPGVRNALYRLLEYHRFRMLIGMRSMENVSRVLNALPSEQSLETTIEDSVLVVLRKSGKQKPKVAKRKRGNFSVTDSPVLDTKQTETDLLRKAEIAYSYAKLDEARQLFQMALSINPGSKSALGGLEKVRAEME